MYSLEEVRQMGPATDPESWFYWRGWENYLDKGVLTPLVFARNDRGRKHEAAYFMGFADAKGEDYGC